MGRPKKIDDATRLMITRLVEDVIDDYWVYDLVSDCYQLIDIRHIKSKKLHKNINIVAMIR